MNGTEQPNSGNTQSIADYLAQLLKDRKQLVAFPNIFIHVERLLEQGKYHIFRLITKHFCHNQMCLQIVINFGSVCKQQVILITCCIMLDFRGFRTSFMRDRCKMFVSVVGFLL